MLEWMGLNFHYFDGLQPKMRAGIINEHECKRYENASRIIFNQWPKLCLGFDVEY